MPESDVDCVPSVPLDSFGSSVPSGREWTDAFGNGPLLSGPLLAPVFIRVFFGRDEFQILDVVVSWISVAVVNLFAARNGSAVIPPDLEMQQAASVSVIDTG